MGVGMLGYMELGKWLSVGADTQGGGTAMTG